MSTAVWFFVFCNNGRRVSVEKNACRLCSRNLPSVMLWLPTVWKISSILWRGYEFGHDVFRTCDRDSFMSVKLH